MSWLADLAGKAEHLLNNLDEQTGAALRNHNVIKPPKNNHSDYAPHPEPVWTPAGKKKLRPPRKPPMDTRQGYLPTRMMSPTNNTNTQSHSQNRTRSLNNKTALQQPRKPPYNLHNCPKTLVGDSKDGDIREHYKNSKRRYSLPSDLEATSVEESLSVKMENLEVENAMIKNELNVTNREVTELLDRLRKTEDGENVVRSSGELVKTNTKLETSELMNRKTNVDKEALLQQIEILKNQIANLTNVEINKYKDQKRELETEVSKLKDRNKDLEELAKLLNEKAKETDTGYIKIENDLRHAHSAINVLQSDLQKSNDECKRLEKDWEAYKHRVKSMLAAKDKEIKSLKQGVRFNEDTKVLVDQIESIKQERDILSEAVTRVRGECQDLKQYVDNLESRHNNAERVVVALRDALKDERSARTRAEAQCNALAKELKCLQIETGQTIVSLRGALREKDNELRNFHDSSTGSNSNSVNATISSAINVADYGDQEMCRDRDRDACRDVSRDSDEKVYYLSQKLVQRQGRIDSLLAENNCMKIQLEKLESKYKNEIENLRSQHSVVQFQDSSNSHHGHRSKSNVVRDPIWMKLGRRLGLILRRFPLFRVFFFVYMVCLHFLVLTVLLSSTPDITKTNSFYKSNNYPLSGVFN